MQVCPNCGEENPPRFRLCGFCGTALGATTEAPETRKTVTNRTGVNTGDVVAGDVSTGQRLVTGDAVNVAARLEQAAPALVAVNDSVAQATSRAGGAARPSSGAAGSGGRGGGS